MPTARALASLVLCVAAIGACDPQDPAHAEACGATCEVLVDDCEVASYPDRQSCYDGCLAGARQGADVESQQACVELAECDLFALVECDHDFGAR